MTLAIPEAPTLEISDPVFYQVVHTIPHRLRIRIPRLAYDAEYGSRLQQLTASLDFVTHVRVNGAASSLIIHHTFADAIAVFQRLTAALHQAVTFQIPQLPTEHASDGLDNLRGMGWMLLATGSFAGMQAVLRLLAASVHPFQIAFISHLVGTLLLTPWIIHHNALKTDQLHLHGVRSLIDTAATLLVFAGLMLIPLAETNALLFTSPLFAMAGAVLFLGEEMHSHNAIALLLGLVGTLVILRPGLEIVGVGSLLVLAGAVAFGGSMFLLKVLSQKDSSLTSGAYSFLLTTVLVLIPALMVWQALTLVEVLGLAIAGILMVAGQVAMGEAFESGDLTAVLPIDFTQLIWSSALGFWLFAEVPTLWVWLGAALIFGGSLYTAQAEASKG